MLKQDFTWSNSNYSVVGSPQFVRVIQKEDHVVVLPLYEGKILFYFNEGNLQLIEGGIKGTPEESAVRLLQSKFNILSKHPREIGRMSGSDLVVANNHVIAVDADLRAKDLSHFKLLTPHETLSAVYKGQIRRSVDLASLIEYLATVV